MSEKPLPKREKKPVKIRIARNSENTYNDYIVPIIFIPGVMGSRLKFISGNVWDPDAAASMILRHWFWAPAEKQRKEMRCAEFEDESYDAVMKDNTALEGDDRLSEEELKRGWAGVSFAFHGQFLRLGMDNYYSEHHHPIYGFAYDWRDSNSRSGKFLKKRVEDILATHKAKKCIIVTHSMGGLVARASLRQAADLTDKVLAVVHICQPAVGTPVPYRRMFTGATIIHDGGNIEAHVFGKAVGNTGEKFCRVASGMDGPLQLLPADGYPNVGDHPWLRYTTPELGDKIGSWSQSFYSSYFRKLQPPGIVEGGIVEHNPDGDMKEVKDDLYQRLTRARVLHKALREENGTLFRHPLTFSLYSRGLPTDVITEFEKPDGIGGFFTRNNPLNYAVGDDGFVLKITEEQQPEDGGDATVAEHSSTSLFPDQQKISPPNTWQEVGSKDNKKDAGIRQYVFSKIEHSKAANNLEINKTTSVIIHRILRTFGKIPG